MKKKFKWILYLLSLELLFVLLFIINTKIYKSDFTFENIFTKKCKFILRDFSDGNFIIWICWLGIILGLYGYWYLKNQMKKHTKNPITVEKIDFNLSDPSSFIASYIVPLIAFNYTNSPRYTLALLIYLIFLGIIYIKTEQYCTNPTLIIFGFNLNKISTKLEKDLESREFLLITFASSKKVEKGDKIKYIDLGNNIILGRNCKK